MPIFTVSLTLILENCSCYGYSFEHRRKFRGDLTYFRASEYPECAVIRPTGPITSPRTLVLQYTLQQRAERYLTLGGRLALDSLYRAVPVHPLINEGKFIAKKATEYCEAQDNISVPVPVCRSAFQINIEPRSKNDALTPLESFSVETLPLLFLFLFL